MLTGPEATIITRAGGAVVRGVKQQATTSPEWPSLHASLMELHAILDQWCTAAGHTTRLIEMKLDDEIGQARQTRFRGRYDFGNSVNMIASQCNSFVMAGEVHAVQIKGSIVNQLTPKVSLVKRLTPEQRRRAARRTLRNMMRVYCPDLLSKFEDATDRRVAWVVANESALMEALAAGSADRDSLLAWAEEARRTTEGLLTVLGELATLITEKYPMGQQGHMGYQ